MGCSHSQSQQKSSRKPYSKFRWHVTSKSSFCQSSPPKARPRSSFFEKTSLRGLNSCEEDSGHVSANSAGSMSNNHLTCDYSSNNHIYSNPFAPAVASLPVQRPSRASDCSGFVSSCSSRRPDWMNDLSPPTFSSHSCSLHSSCDNVNKLAPQVQRCSMSWQRRLSQDDNLEAQQLQPVYQNTKNQHNSCVSQFAIQRRPLPSPPSQLHRVKNMDQRTLSSLSVDSLVANRAQKSRTCRPVSAAPFLKVRRHNRACSTVADESSDSLSTVSKPSYCGGIESSTLSSTSASSSRNRGTLDSRFYIDCLLHSIFSSREGSYNESILFCGPQLNNFSVNLFPQDFTEFVEKQRKQAVYEMQTMLKDHSKLMDEHILKIQLTREQHVKQFTADLKNIMKKMASELSFAEGETKAQLEQLFKMTAKNNHATMKRSQQEHGRRMALFRENQRKQQKLAAQAMIFEVSSLPKEQREKTLSFHREKLKFQERENRRLYNERLWMTLSTLQEKQRRIQHEKESFLRQCQLRNRQSIKEEFERKCVDAEEREMIAQQKITMEQVEGIYLLARTQLLQRHELELQHYVTVHRHKEDKLMTMHVDACKQLSKMTKRETKKLLELYQHQNPCVDVAIQREQVRAFARMKEQDGQATQMHQKQQHQQQWTAMQREQTNQLAEIGLFQRNQLAGLHAEEISRIAEIKLAYSEALRIFWESRRHS